MRLILFLTSFMIFSAVATAGIYDNIDGAEWVGFHKEGLSACSLESSYKPELGICMADLAKAEVCPMARRGSLPESYTASQEEFYSRECREPQFTALDIYKNLGFQWAGLRQIKPGIFVNRTNCKRGSYIPELGICWDKASLKEELCSLAVIGRGVFGNSMPGDPAKFVKKYCLAIDPFQLSVDRIYQTLEGVELIGSSSRAPLEGGPVMGNQSDFDSVTKRHCDGGKKGIYNRQLDICWDGKSSRRELCAIAHIGWGHLANSVRGNLVKFIKKSCKRQKAY